MTAPTVVVGVEEPQENPARPDLGRLQDALLAVILYCNEVVPIYRLSIEKNSGVEPGSHRSELTRLIASPAGNEFTRLSTFAETHAGGHRPTKCIEIGEWVVWKLFQGFQPSLADFRQFIVSQGSVEFRVP